MSNYYADSLNSSGLVQVYNTSIPRIRRYLEEEVNYVRKHLTGKESILELGAGYGRIVRQLAGDCRSITGIDISLGNVNLAKDYLKDSENTDVRHMDVHSLSMDERYDVILCLQNGLSAMKISSELELKGILDNVASGGRAFFSTYSQKFWKHRLDWFIEQADKGLLGEIDFERTGDGIIVCKDGFRAITHTHEELNRLGELSGYPFIVEEVDESSLFLVIQKA